MNKDGKCKREQDGHGPYAAADSFYVGSGDDLDAGAGTV